MIPTQPAALINTTKSYPNPISLHSKPATHWAQGLFMCTGSKSCYSTIFGCLQELQKTKKKGEKKKVGNKAWLGFVRQVRKAQGAAWINDP